MPSIYQTPPNNNPKKKMSTGMFIFLVVGGVFIFMALLCALSLFLFFKLFKSDDGASSDRNQQWVSKMNETFPDDKFSFKSYEKTNSSIIVKNENKNIIIVSSANYPDKKITVGWNEDKAEVVTNYNFTRYNEDLDNYYTAKLNQYFNSDKIRVDFATYYQQTTPIENYSFDEFVMKHAGCNIDVFLKYNSDFPSEEEITKVVDRIIADIDFEIEMDIYLSHNTVDDIEDIEGNEKYYLMMDGPKKIQCFNHNITHYTGGEKSRRQDMHSEIYKDKDLD